MKAAQALSLQFIAVRHLRNEKIYAPDMRLWSRRHAPEIHADKHGNPVMADTSWAEAVTSELARWQKSSQSTRELVQT